MIAHVGRAERYRRPAGRGEHWSYVELEIDVTTVWSIGVELQVLRGWVNSRKLGSRHFEEWLTHELLQKLRGLARVQRFARARHNPSADYTSAMLSAICSVLLVPAAGA